VYVGSNPTHSARSGGRLVRQIKKTKKRLQFLTKQARSKKTTLEFGSKKLMPAVFLKG